MLNWLGNVAGLLTLVGAGVLVWHLWGRAARAAGTSRLVLLGMIALLGKLLG